MTLGQLKTYLKSIGAAGITQQNLDSTADVAIEAGYASVWGAYSWKIKRRQFDSTTTAGQTYTSLPSDFETVKVILVKSTGRPLAVDIMEEEMFDKNFPKTNFWSTEQPFAAKVGYNASGGNGDKWRIWWFRIPDQAYTISVVYEAKADSAEFPNLPSYMQDAVISKCAALMQTGAEQRLAYNQIAEQAVQRAIFSDRTSSEKAVQWGGDPGWDDFATAERRGNSGSVWHPLS